MAEASRIAAPMMVADFRAWAGRQPGKWELVDGRPRAMAPASTTHGLIQARAAFLIERHIEDTQSPCRSASETPVVPSSFKRHNARATDLAITCSPRAADEWALHDPVFILENLSPSNEQDTRDNAWAYMTILSVRQILLLDSTTVRGEMCRRRANGTWPEEAESLGAWDIVHSKLIQFSCPVDSFYARTNLASP